MLEELLKIDLPDVYQEGLIEYVEKLDGFGIIDLIRLGIDKKRARKMLQLYGIERMKFLVKEPNDFTEEELEYAQKRIEEEIKNYNNMNY